MKELIVVTKIDAVKKLTHMCKLYEAGVPIFN